MATGRLAKVQTFRERPLAGRYLFIGAVENLLHHSPELDYSTKLERGAATRALGVRRVRH